MKSTAGFWFRKLILISFFIGAISVWPAPAQQKAPAAEEKPKIRAITAFINLDRAQYREQVADALKMLRRAQVTFESRGYQVQTIRKYRDSVAFKENEIIATPTIHA